jgi:hypothetical protein
MTKAKQKWYHELGQLGWIRGLAAGTRESASQKCVLPLLAGSASLTQQSALAGHAESWR